MFRESSALRDLRDLREILALVDLRGSRETPARAARVVLRGHSE